MTPRESLLAAMEMLSARRNDLTNSYAVRLADTYCAEFVRHHGPALLAALDDAERYRWLRSAGSVSWDMIIDAPGDGNIDLCVDVPPYRIQAETIDAAIDAARKA